MRYCPFCLASYRADDALCASDASPTVATREEAQKRSLLNRTLGTYLVTRAVARGGMGEVYEAVHPQIGRRVAVKVLGQEALQDQGYVQRFFNEARTVNLIHHPNIIEVLDLAALGDKRPYLVMEFLEGESLGARLKRTPKLLLPELGQIFLPVIDALTAAHGQGILHRDLKPDNIYLQERHGELVPKILDFGIAKMATGNAALTQSGIVLGTPRYMAPEQARGLELSAATDIYALGVILFECLCGRPPFAADAYAELLVQHIMNPPPKPRSLRPDLPRSIEEIVLRALEKEPSQRFETAREIGDALHAALLAAGVAAGDLPAPKRRGTRGDPSGPTALPAADMRGSVGGVAQDAAVAEVSTPVPALGATSESEELERMKTVVSANPYATADAPPPTGPQAPSQQTMRSAAAEIVSTSELMRAKGRSPVLLAAAAGLVLSLGGGAVWYLTAGGGAGGPGGRSGAGAGDRARVPGDRDAPPRGGSADRDDGDGDGDDRDGDGAGRDGHDRDGDDADDRDRHAKDDGAKDGDDAKPTPVKVDVAPPATAEPARTAVASTSAPVTEPATAAATAAATARPAAAAGKKPRPPATAKPAPKKTAAPIVPDLPIAPEDYDKKRPR